MDGEQRSTDAGWPAARPSRQAPDEPAPRSDPGATQVFGYAPQSHPPQSDSPQSQPDYGRQSGPHGSGEQGSREHGSGGPSRSVVLISLGVAALLAVIAGTVYAFTRPLPASTVATATSSTPIFDTPEPNPTEPTPSASTSTPSGTTPTPTPTATATATGAAAPTGFVSDPWAQGLDFGTVTAVKKQGGGAAITVRRQTFLTRGEAQTYYAQHPDLETLDYAIVDGGETHRYTLSGDAVIYGQYLLGDGDQVATTQLTVPQFVKKSKQLLGKSIPLRVWMHHQTSPDGTVLYLAEQYIP